MNSFSREKRKNRFKMSNKGALVLLLVLAALFMYYPYNQIVMADVNSKWLLICYRWEFALLKPDVYV